MPQKYISEKINLDNPDTYITCAICGGHYQGLFNHVKQYGFTGYSYLAKFGGVLKCKDFKDRQTKAMVETLALSEQKQRWRDVQIQSVSKFTKEELQIKYGKNGEDHPLFGKHQSVESILKNSGSNVRASKLLKERLIREGKWEVYIASRVNRGRKNGMYGRIPPKGSGRCRYIDYVSVISGKSFCLQGSYELRFAKLLDRLACDWEKTKDMFPYQFKGVGRTYHPDFKVRHANGHIVYYETKGYIDEEAKAKFAMMYALNIPFIVVNKERLLRYEQKLKMY
jgi:hypothetical protein